MIIGHEKQRAFLDKSIFNNRVPHALLFSGRESLGKKKIALEFLNKLAQKELSYPDLILVESEKGIISINQIREIKKTLNLKSDFKAIVVDNAHLMNLDAQNCFLKTLEEPHENVYFILISSQPSMLAKTILSRCSELKFYQSDFSSEKNKKNYKKAMSVSQGRHGVFLSLIKDEKLLQKEIEKKEEIKEFLEKDLKDKFLFSKKMFKGESFDLNNFLDRIVSFQRQELIKGDYSKKKDIRETENLKFISLSYNINKRLGFENLILKL